MLMSMAVDAERGERLKQAKIEAEAEINAYRKQQEHAFQMNANTDVSICLSVLQGLGCWV